MIAGTQGSYFLSLLHTIRNIVGVILGKLPYLGIQDSLSQPYYLGVILITIITIACGYIISHLRKEPYILFGTYLGHILCWLSFMFTYIVLFFGFGQEIVDLTPFGVIFPGAPNTTGGDVPPNQTLLPFIIYIIFCFIVGILVAKIIDNKYKVVLSHKKHIFLILLLLYLFFSGISIVSLLYD